MRANHYDCTEIDDCFAPFVNRVYQPDARCGAQIIERQHTFLYLSARQQLSAEGSRKKSASDRRRDPGATDLSYDIGGGGFRDLPGTIPQNHVVVPECLRARLFV